MQLIDIHMVERRKHLRIPFWSIIRYRIKEKNNNNTEIIYGNSKNISVGGICFETYEAIEKGTLLEITLALPSSPVKRIVIEGEVLRCEKINLRQIYSIGVAFRQVSSKDMFAFAEFIEHYTRNEKN